MSEVKKIATRASYGAALVELGKKHENLVVLDADLAAATQTGVFKKEFPERHIDCGIAECNMMGIAAGLATTGKVPFASTFAMFAAGRAFEQVRNSIAYPKINVKIGATHGGISVGEDGATHQCCEDFALMRVIPGMVVACPSDDIEAKAMVEAAYEHVGPVYMRFGRLAVPVINDRPDYKFELGKGIVLREGKEETGLDVRNAEGGYLFTYKRENPGEGDNYFVDVYRFVMDIDESDLHLQTEETDGYMFATVDEIKAFAAEGKFLHYDSIKKAFE